MHLNPILYVFRMQAPKTSRDHQRHNPLEHLYKHAKLSVSHCLCCQLRVYVKVNRIAGRASIDIDNDERLEIA